MDVIKNFNTEVDVGHCEKLYDYGYSTYHFRPADGQWDLSVFSDRGQHTNVSKEDENTMVRVDKMDKIINRSSFMEKGEKGKEEKGKEEKSAGAEMEILSKWNDFDYMHPNQKLPNRVLPVFKPGDIVKGSVILELSQPLDAKGLEIVFEGQAMTLVYVYNQYGGAPVKGKHVYVNENKTVWQKVDGGRDDLSDKFALISTNDTPLQSKLLPAGNHKFAFEFSLPSDCPGSTPNLIPSSWIYYAYVLYRVKAKIDSGKRFTKDPVTYKGLWVDQKMDIASDVDDMSPFTVDESLDSGIAFWKGGRVSCTAKLPRRAFVRGEEIPLTLEIENQASEKISEVIAQVRLRGKSRTGTGKLTCTHSIDLKGKKVKEGEIAGSQSKVIQIKVPLDFSESAIDSNLIPAGTLSDCPLIDVRYELTIKVKRPGMHRNTEMNIPIKIGSVNSKFSPSERMYPKLY